MAFEITRVDIWSGAIKDRPGALAEQLGTIMQSGASLDFIIVRRSPDNPGTGVLFAAPLIGASQEVAARDAGMSKSESMHALRIIGPDRPGLGAGIARTLANEDLNIAGLSAAVIGDRVVMYFRFDSDDELVRASQVLTPMLT